MRMQLIAVGTRMPDWVNSGFKEYAERLPPDWRLTLTEIPAGKRHKNSKIKQLLEKEGERLVAAVSRNARTIALDVNGQQWSTEKLAQQLDNWAIDGRDLALLVGGPEGLDPALLNQVGHCWSLSKLTFPHPLVRVVLAEQLYRAWSILHNHPYHRA